MTCSLRPSHKGLFLMLINDCRWRGWRNWYSTHPLAAGWATVQIVWLLSFEPTKSDKTCWRAEEPLRYLMKTQKWVKRHLCSSNRWFTWAAGSSFPSRGRWELVRSRSTSFIKFVFPKIRTGMWNRSRGQRAGWTRETSEAYVRDNMRAKQLDRQMVFFNGTCGTWSKCSLRVLKTLPMLSKNTSCETQQKLQTKPDL